MDVESFTVGLTCLFTYISIQFLKSGLEDIKGSGFLSKFIETGACVKRELESREILKRGYSSNKVIPRGFFRHFSDGELEMILVLSEAF